MFNSCSCLQPILAALVAAAYISTASCAPLRRFIFEESRSSVEGAVSSCDGDPEPRVYAAGYGTLQLFQLNQSGATSKNATSSIPSFSEVPVPLYLIQPRNQTFPVRPTKTAAPIQKANGTDASEPPSTVTPLSAPEIIILGPSPRELERHLNATVTRNAMLPTMIPLELAPLFSALSYSNGYWASTERNSSEWNLFLTELASSENAFAQLMIQSLLHVLPDIDIGLYDSERVLSDHPANYYNGTEHHLDENGIVYPCIFHPAPIGLHDRGKIGHFPVV